MTRLERLIQEAKKACKLRGHIMQSFTRKYRAFSYSKCKLCGMRVYVIVKPLPNEIDIGGGAVALDCIGQTPQEKVT
jgi:hypothetical protein